MTEQEKRELLKLYIKDTFLGLVIFAIFVSATIVLELVARIVAYFGMPIPVLLIRVVGWSISVFGVYSTIYFIYINTCDFISKLRGKGPLQEPPNQKDTGKREDK